MSKSNLLSIIIASSLMSLNLYARTPVKVPVLKKNTTAGAIVTAPQSFSVSSIVTEKTDEKVEEVPLLKSVVLKSATDQIDLKKVAHGIRKKVVFGLIPVKVYSLQFFAQHPEKINKADDMVLASLKTAGPLHLNFTFLRDLSGTKISDSFKEGLEANKLDLKKIPLELDQVLKEISAIKEFKKGETFTATAVWNNDQESLYLQYPNGEIKAFTGSGGFVEQFLSIWFGTPADSLLKELKKTLLK